MATIDFVVGYLDGALDFDDLHARVQTTHLRRRPDQFSAEVLRVMGEATSANWPDEEIHEALGELVKRSRAHGHIAVPTSSPSGQISVRLGVKNSYLRIAGHGGHRTEGNTQELTHSAL
ncbi:MAG: hypothetical protein WD250_13125 [Egibacteraceae bacterium]